MRVVPVLAFTHFAFSSLSILILFPRFLFLVPSNPPVIPLNAVHLSCSDMTGIGRPVALFLLSSSFLRFLYSSQNSFVSTVFYTVICAIRVRKVDDVIYLSFFKNSIIPILCWQLYYPKIHLSCMFHRMLLPPYILLALKSVYFL